MIAFARAAADSRQPAARGPQPATLDPRPWTLCYLPLVIDEAPPRNLIERTGKHHCIRCLAEVPLDVFLRNDHICDVCAESDEYPLKSTPDANGTK